MLENRPTISGKNAVKRLVETLLINIRAGCHTFIWGNTGAGKTSIVSQLCTLLDANVSYVQPAAMDATDLEGTPVMLARLKDGRQVVLSGQNSPEMGEIERVETHFCRPAFLNMGEGLSMCVNLH
jgi:MoxR-like ATPase